MMLVDDTLVTRAPRLAAALTFGGVAILHVAIVIALMGIPDSMLMPALYVVVHALAGAIGGHTIPDPLCTPTARRGAVRGVAVMGLALLLLWVVTLAIVLPNPAFRSEAVSSFETPSAGHAFYGVTTRLGLAYLAWMWWLIPLGALAGALLYAWPRHGMIRSIGD